MADDSKSGTPSSPNGTSANAAVTSVTRATSITTAEYSSFYQKKEYVSQFWKEKYDREANKFWDNFYKRNTTNFFKDRHWLTREFNELRAAAAELSSEEQKPPGVVAVEVGCGVGNTIFPLLESVPSLFIYGLDFSRRAIEFVKQNPAYDEQRCKAYVCDITKDELPDEILSHSVDFALMIFVLSAIAPEKMPQAIRRVARALKVGGSILFRDYAVGDLAQLRFDQEGGKKLGENFYVRSDGTQAYYFSEAFVQRLFTEAGFEVKQLEVVERTIENRKKELSMARRWLQGKFVKRRDSQCNAGCSAAVNSSDEHLMAVQQQSCPS